MNRIILINSETNRQFLKDAGYDIRQLGKAVYLHVYLDTKEVESLVYTAAYPWLTLDKVAPLLIMPDYKSRALYLLSEGLVSCYNPLLTREVLDEYYASIDSSMLSHKQYLLSFAKDNGI